MADLEKVLAALELCASEQSFRVCVENHCPYIGGFESCNCITALQRDALALLKEQESRVMTLSGVRNLKESTPVWLEDVDKKDVIGALFMRDYSGTKCVDFAIVCDWEFERVVADYMDYGVRWRCWTSRPSDEVRRTTPWND